MIVAMVGSNVAGGIAVVLFVIFVLSDALGLSEVSTGTRMRDLVLAAVYVAVVAAVGPAWSLRRGRVLRAAREVGRPPTDAERRLALAGPVRQLEINALWWGGGAVLFLAVSAPDSWRFAATQSASCTRRRKRFGRSPAS